MTYYVVYNHKDEEEYIEVYETYEEAKTEYNRLKSNAICCNYYEIELSDSNGVIEKTTIEEIWEEEED